MWLWLTLQTALATWSITAVDDATREVGVAGATCGPMVWGIAGVVPGEGVVAAQYATNLSLRNRAVGLLRGHIEPYRALDTLLAEDAQTPIRQYGIVALGKSPAIWTGGDVELPAGARTGESFSVQGNTLASEAVLDAAAAVFEADPDAPLADRLLAALEAGAAEGGDSRCDPSDAARSAFLFVAQPDDKVGAASLELRASGKGAVAKLAESYPSGGCATAPGASLLAAGLAGLLARRTVPRRRALTRCQG